MANHNFVSQLYNFVAATSAVFVSHFEKVVVSASAWEAGPITSKISKDPVHCAALCQKSRCYEFIFEETGNCKMNSVWLDEIEGQIGGIEVFRMTEGKTTPRGA